MAPYLIAAAVLLALAAEVITRRRRARRLARFLAPAGPISVQPPSDLAPSYFRHDPGFADCTDPACCGGVIADEQPEPTPEGGYSPRLTRYERYGLDGLPRPVYWSSGDPYAAGDASGQLSPWKPSAFCSWGLSHCAEPAIPGDPLGYCILHRNRVLGASTVEVAR